MTAEDSKVRLSPFLNNQFPLLGSVDRMHLEIPTPLILVGLATMAVSHANPIEEAEAFNAALVHALSQDQGWEQKARELSEKDDAAYRSALNSIYSSRREIVTEPGPDQRKYRGLTDPVLHRAIQIGLQMQPEPSDLGRKLSNIVSIDTEGKMAGNASTQILKMLLKKGDYSSNGSLDQALHQFKPEARMQIYEALDVGMHRGTLAGDEHFDFLVSAYKKEKHQANKTFIKTSLAKFGKDPSTMMTAEEERALQFQQEINELFKEKE